MLFELRVTTLDPEPTLRQWAYGSLGEFEKDQPARALFDDGLVIECAVHDAAGRRVFGLPSGVEFNTWARLNEGLLLHAQALERRRTENKDG